MENLERALLIAEKAHSNQSYDVYPYIFHVKQVVDVARRIGYEETILIACALHDVLEDSELSFNDIKKAFGEEVAEIVYCVTDELGRNRQERKSKTYLKIQSNYKATIVKICDRIANVNHSKIYNKRLFEMYKKEHESFCTNLMSKEHGGKTNEAWKELNLIFKRY